MGGLVCIDRNFQLQVPVAYWHSQAQDINCSLEAADLFAILIGDCFAGYGLKHENDLLADL